MAVMKFLASYIEVQVYEKKEETVLSEPSGQKGREEFYGIGIEGGENRIFWFHQKLETAGEP